MTPETNLCADEFMVLTSIHECPLCKHKVRVAALAVPHAHRVRFEPAGPWETGDEGPLVLTGIVDLNYDAIEALQATRVQIRIDHSQTAGHSYWMNHCDGCGAKIGDHFLTTPGGGFCPDSAEAAMAIVRRDVRKPLEAETGWANLGALEELLSVRH